jgi:acyl-CoA thioester hydrolase
MATHCDVQIRVRYPECDPMGYLHHARYFEYFEIGRTELMRQNGHAHSELERSGILFVVARLDCRFRKPAHYDDVLTLATTLSRTTPIRIDHTYTMKRDHELLCTATSTLACVDRDGQLGRVPEFLRL